MLIGAAICPAEDFTLTDGTVLENARVVRQDGESAIISHATGVQRIPYTRLSPELQARLDLTPEAVEARRAKSEQEERERALAREKKAAQQREALAVSGLSPRYLTGADIIAIYSSWNTLSATAAEYLAAEWNRREALRCGLTIEAQRHKEDAAQLLHHMETERTEIAKKQEQSDSLDRQLQNARQDLAAARAEIKRLESLNSELRNRPSQGTVVISEPTVVPVYRPSPIILPPVHQPRPPMRPPQKSPQQPQIPQPPKSSVRFNVIKR